MLFKNEFLVISNNILNQLELYHANIIDINTLKQFLFKCKLYISFLLLEDNNTDIHYKSLESYYHYLKKIL